MPRKYVDVIVGGQAGSEGKGAVAGHLAREKSYAAAVRPGSTNAGHTVYQTDPPAQAVGEWESYVHQVLPSAATVSPSMDLLLAPESSFGLDELFEELQDAIDRWARGEASLMEERVLERLVIDPKAAVITQDHRKKEADRKLGDDIGSTVHGCGAVRVEKIWRSAGDVRLAEDYGVLRRFLPENRQRGPDARRVPGLIQEYGRRGSDVLVEGTQGTLLSMNQSDHWPFSTSRDCTASAFLSSCGLPPSAVRHTWAVFRTYPIRVGGHSGPLDGNEIDFQTIAERAGFDDAPVEYTSVTNKKRRIFEWSWNQFETAMRLSDPTHIAITFLDYLDAGDYGASDLTGLSEESLSFLANVSNRADEYGATLAMAKTGPEPGHYVDLSGGLPQAVLDGDEGAMQEMARQAVAGGGGEPEKVRGPHDAGCCGGDGE